MNKLIIFLSIILFSSLSFGDDLYSTMAPLPSEKLSQPIALTGSCKLVKVVEWRPTPNQESQTSINKKSIDILNFICKKVIKNFPKFIETQKYKLNEELKLSQSLSLMPADLKNHGRDFRNLNDLTYRFKNRTKEYDENGNPYPIWGYHQRASSFIYMRNDVLNENGEINKGFEIVFAHELFHSLSWKFGIYQQHKGNKDIIEEEMARKFTMFLYGAE